MSSRFSQQVDRPISSVGRVGHTFGFDARIVDCPEGMMPEAEEMMMIIIIIM